MRRLTLVFTLPLICGVASAALAQEATAANPPSNAALRAEIHRTIADLIEARAADEPDQEQIQKRTEELRDLRGKLGHQARGGRTGRWQGAWGGPRGHRGPGAAFGAGMGPGRGRGMGPTMGGRGGRGRGAGLGAGMGPGRGRGMGPTMGGRGGRGRGAGPGAGFGRGRGRGRGFVDEDGDGVCDYFQGN